MGIPFLKSKAELVEEKTKVQIEYVAVALMVVLGLMVFFDFGANIICNIVGFIYPMIATITAIESDGKDDDTYWLVYWVVFGFFGVIEAFVDYVIFWIPFYYPIKLAFLLWCMLPQVIIISILVA
jgi:receptor expression-enhancing protein 5/6